MNPVVTKLSDPVNVKLGTLIKVHLFLYKTDAVTWFHVSDYRNFLNNERW